MRIHLIAIGGSAMHNLALALHQMGHIVTGSDDEIFEPSKSRLESAGLLPSESGWFPEKITSDIEVIVVGMHAREDNPELLKANELRIKTVSYPQFIYEHSRNKHRIVICGSHGKTTITSMIMHVMRAAGRKFDYLVGAQVEGFDTMVRLSDDAPTLIVEGDEYLAAPIQRVPKFLVYQPHMVVISGISWDHINVFPTEEQYVDQFALLLKRLDKAGMVIYNEDDVAVRSLVKKNTQAESHYLYPYSTPAVRKRDFSFEVKIENQKGVVPFFGKHNFSNMAAAWQVMKLLAMNPKTFLHHMSSFRGAAFRLQKIYEDDKNVVIKDFAHSPSKVKASVAAVAEVYDKKQIIACLELHTFSSLNKEFLKQYKKTLKAIRKKVVFVNEHTIRMKNMLPITREEIIQAFEDKDIQFVTTREELIRVLGVMHGLKNVFLMMSSGNFGGLDLAQLPQLGTSGFKS
jgi:UDP-N-acetylmuramate: L-alanyl-gamma-D-glutamyl-meso-diaminopimelate ligase